MKFNVFINITLWRPTSLSELTSRKTSIKGIQSMYVKDLVIVSFVKLNLAEIEN